jgi:hypothetical protein
MVSRRPRVAALDLTCGHIIRKRVAAQLAGARRMPGSPSYPPMPMPMLSYTAGRLRLFEQRVCDGIRSMRFSCLGSIEVCPTLGAVMPVPRWAIGGGMGQVQRSCVRANSWRERGRPSHSWQEPIDWLRSA